MPAVPLPILHLAMVTLILSAAAAMLVLSGRALRQIREELANLSAELGWTNATIPRFTTGMSVPLKATFGAIPVSATFHAREKAVPPRLALSHHVATDGDLVMHLRPSHSNVFSRPLFARPEHGSQFDPRFVVYTEELSFPSKLFADRELIEELHTLFQNHNGSLTLRRNMLSLNCQVAEAPPKMITEGFGLRRSILRPARENIEGLAREEWRLLRKIVTRLA